MRNKNQFISHRLRERQKKGVSKKLTSLNISTFPKKTQYDPVPLNTATTVFNRITMSPVIDQS